MWVLEPDQIRELDRRTIEELGLPGAVLMETAGRGVVRAILARIGGGRGRLATVLCGVGNNGGDGFVIARELLYAGFRVHVWVAGKVDQMSPETALHYKVMKGVGIQGRNIDGKQKQRPGDLKGLHRSLLRSAVIVDALMGIGAKDELRDPVRTLVEQVDGRHDALVVGVDVPSGVSAADGRILGAAARCDLVITMAAAKPGLLLGAGARCAGEVEVVDIGVPPAWVSGAPRAGQVLSAADGGALLPRRDEEGHKTRFGHLMAIAGAPGTSGAALLCATAAMRSGVGVCTLATAGEIRTRLEAQVPDLMVEAIRGGAQEAKRVAKLVEGRDALAMGPGMGTNASAIDLVMRVLASSTAPAVLDADALTNLAARPDIGEPAAGRLVLSPHPGEMARLLGVEIADVLSDRLGVARKAAQKWKAVVVLKGPRTLIVRPDGGWAICNRPDAALAKAGSGDVLCGIIGALLAQRLNLFDAACLGVLAHNAAGRHVAGEKGAISAMASDLIDALPDAWRELAEAADLQPPHQAPRRRRSR